MTRILVFSDTHGQTEQMMKIIRNFPPLDGIIHLGDINRDIRELEDTFFDIPIYGVEGNNDHTGLYPNEKTITIEGKKIFITHGHYYISNSDPSRLKTIPATEKADLILHGHTHIAYREEFDEKIIANPGSLTKPISGGPSYGVIEIDDGELRYCNISLPTPF